jgi:hypothetical protein
MLALIAFGFSMAVVNALLHPGQCLPGLSILTPFIEIIGSFALDFIGFPFQTAYCVTLRRIPTG